MRPGYAAEMTMLRALACTFAALLLTAFAPATITGRVVGVTDGDTVRVLTPAHELLKVRLTEIDAPEHSQPFGEKSKQMLSGMVFGREVHYVAGGQDRYGRTLARLYNDRGQDVSAEMVRQGGAWAFRRYLTDPTILPLEAEARRAHRGLWALQADQIKPPWEWRRDRRHGH